jgi:hypothetical protein
MYYRVAIRREGEQREGLPNWQWKSTSLSSLQTLFQFLRLYRALPHDRLRVFSSSSRKEMDEQLVRENQGLGSPSVTAAQFLQERMIRSSEGTWGTADRGAEGCQETASTKTRLNEGRSAALLPDERETSSLERRREEIESGAGGDHDSPYLFTLPPSMPQVFAWMRLLARIQGRQLQP